MIMVRSRLHGEPKVRALGRAAAVRPAGGRRGHHRDGVVDLLLRERRGDVPGRGIEEGSRDRGRSFSRQEGWSNGRGHSHGRRVGVCACFKSTVAAGRSHHDEGAACCHHHDADPIVTLLPRGATDARRATEETHSSSVTPSLRIRRMCLRRHHTTSHDRYVRREWAAASRTRTICKYIHVGARFEDRRAPNQSPPFVAMRLFEPTSPAIGSNGRWRARTDETHSSSVRPFADLNCRASSPLARTCSALRLENEW